MTSFANLLEPCHFNATANTYCSPCGRYPFRKIPFAKGYYGKDNPLAGALNQAGKTKAKVNCSWVTSSEREMSQMPERTFFQMPLLNAAVESVSVSFQSVLVEQRWRAVGPCSVTIRKSLEKFLGFCARKFACVVSWPAMKHSLTTVD